MSILRTKVMSRANAVPLGSDWYDQGSLDEDGPNMGWRPDCSGWVSYCWDCPRSGPGTWGGYSTMTFLSHKIMFEIPWSEIKAGDAIGRCNPLTTLNGHICLFKYWVSGAHGPGGVARTLEHGSGWGPKDMNRTVPSDYKAYRFVNIEEADGTTYPGGIPSWENNMFCKKGDGGEDVYYLQRRLLRLKGENPDAWVKGQGSLPLWGPDKAWGDEVSRLLTALGLDPNVFDGKQAELLDQKESAARAVSASALTAAVREELVKAVAVVPAVAPTTLKLQLS